ncbi:Protein phosphatase methylesterase 1 [Tieghemiomyces parasiticus]|uniref:Protein phosphatase methylesterase 1 n=1 Tax=Tieghemiomyces parasiticus TaxID=78921 RepID=A0A9W7ZRS6_9FUNG|nr:Protein phosphatase methylesterase 1 [Tieghemiomyces parasiticus]
MTYQSRRDRGPLFVFHHGAGHAALAFALVAQRMRQKYPDEMSFLAYDCRGHGDTHTDGDLDLSLDTLAGDFKTILDALYPNGSHPQVFLVGHSMGGAVVTQIAYKQLVPNLGGFVVIDIVEGNAMAALGKIKKFCETRPQKFRSVSDTIAWFLHIRAIVNVESAQVSVPPLVVEESSPEGPAYVWRTDLGASEQYWKDWFQGLTDKFLQAKGAKMLMLAGPERLDKPMMIAQMQGKFQPVMFPDSGHAIQEDHPDEVARSLIEIWQRSRPLTLPPKLPRS